MDINLPTRGTEAQPQDRTMAALANAVYDPAIREPVPGWRAIDEHERRSMGISSEQLDDRKTGFLANVYTNDHGSYVVAMAGTDASHVADYVTNVRQYVGLPAKQYDQARALTAIVVNAAGRDQVAVTGHSLGGSLASTAALRHGVPAVVFNAAPVHDRQLANPAQDRAAGVAGQVRHYEMPGEFLGHLRRSPSQNRGLPGVSMSLTSAHGRVDPQSMTAPLGLHGMNATISSMNRNEMFHGNNQRSLLYYQANVRHTDPVEAARVRQAVDYAASTWQRADTPEERRRAQGTERRLAGEVSRDEPIRREGGYLDREVMLARQAPQSPQSPPSAFSSRISTPRVISPSPGSPASPTETDRRFAGPPADSELAAVMRRTRSAQSTASSGTSPFSPHTRAKGKEPDRGR